MKWEYWVCRNSFYGYQDEMEWLDAQGREGWELVAVRKIDKDSQYAYYFKHLLSEERKRVESA